MIKYLVSVLKFLRSFLGFGAHQRVDRLAEILSQYDTINMTQSGMTEHRLNALQSQLNLARTEVSDLKHLIETKVLKDE